LESSEEEMMKKNGHSIQAAALTIPIVLLPLSDVVRVQLWAAAPIVTLALLASAAYLLKRALGLVKQPPPEEEAHH